jgi:serine/threonine-protein kinase
MPADASAVLMTLAFEDVRDLQLQWAVIEEGSVFVPWSRPMPSETPVRLHVAVAHVGTADVDGIVDFNDVDSFGRPGAVVRLPRPSIEALRKLHERSLAPPRASAPDSVPFAFSETPPPGSTSWPGGDPLKLDRLAAEGPLPRQSPTSKPRPPTLDDESTLVLLDELVPPEHHDDDAKAPAPNAPAASPWSAPPPQASPGVPPRRSPGAPPEHPETTAMPAGTSPNELGEERLEPGTLLDGRFQIEAHIATGGMGEVYRAAHIFLKRAIALKLLKRALLSDPEMWTRFQREAELVSQLESQHIVRVFDFGRTSAGMPFLAMEFVQGVTLDLWLAKEGPMSPERAAGLVAQVCEGLEEAHALGIIHRDLKPGNIILGKRRDGSELAKILDFGIARGTNAKTGRSVTQTGMVVGTPAYLSPEQAVADQVDARTDVYSLGCVIFELLTGQPPFDADTAQKLMTMHLTETPPNPATIRKELADYPGLCEVIAKSLAKDRKHRFQSAKELATALRASVKKQNIPGAFDDWPPADASLAGEATQVSEDAAWPPPAGAAPPSMPWDDAKPAAPPPAEDAWPVAPAPPAAPPPAPASPGPGVSSFFTFETGKHPAVGKPGPVASPVPDAPDQRAPHKKSRLTGTLEALKVPVPSALVQRLSGQRAQLELGTRKLAMLHIEVLRAPKETGERAAALGLVVRYVVEHDGVIDSLDEDGVTVVFEGQEALASSVRAIYAAMCAREALTLQNASLRAAAVFGKADVAAADEPIAGELPLRARTLAAKTPAGKITVDRALVPEVQDVVSLAELSSEAVEAVDRRSPLVQVNTLYGREAILGALDKRLASLSQGVISPVLLTGESGAGRSTLAQELGVRARHQQAIVGVARVLPSLRGQPYAGLAELLCNVCGVAKEQRLSKLPQALEALKLSAPDLEAALVVAGVRNVPQPFTPGQAVWALRAALNAGAPGRKVLFVFDGLESMDPYSIDAFRELCARPAQRELTVGLCEPAFAREALPQVPVAELPALHVTEVSAMVSAWLGGVAVSEKLVEAVSRRSRGLPGLVIDWLHLLADRGLIRQRAGAFVLGAEPPTCDDAELAVERCHGLWPFAGALFEATCLGEDSIEGSLLNALLPSVPPPAYQRLVSSRLLRALGGRRWAVASERYQKAALKVEGPHRPALHKRMAQVLVEAARASGTPADAARVAEHLTKAKEPTLALPLWRQVAEAALSRRSPREAMVALRGWANGLRQACESPNATPEMHKARTDMLARAAANAVACGEPLLAGSLVDEGQYLVKDKNVSSPELALSHARVLRSEARRARALEALEQAQQRAGSGPILFLVLAERGEALEAEGDLSGAAQAFQQALQGADAAQELARWHGEIDFRARVETRLAGVLLAQKDVASAKKIYLSALGGWRRSSFAYAEARVLANLGAVSVQTKELDEAARQFKEAAAAAARSGDLLFQARQMLNLAKVLKRSEQLTPARQAASAARAIATQIAWEEGQAQAAALGPVTGTLPRPS